MQGEQECTHIIFPDGKPMEQCGKTPAMVYRFHFPGYFDQYRGQRVGDRVGETFLCPEHYDDHREDPPNPDNLVPIGEQWRQYDPSPE